MKQIIVKNLKPIKGFSLIELLIVIAIIGIIATVAIPILMAVRQNSLDERARQNTRAVLTAEQAYYSKTGSFGGLAALAGASPPFLDNRFSSGTGVMGHGQVVTLVLNGSGIGFSVTSTNPQGTMDYTANEDMVIVSVPH